jgi:hypothetical protein
MIRYHQRTRSTQQDHERSATRTEIQARPDRASETGRPHGWAKIHSAREAHGVINLEWHGRTGVLICRVVTKFGNKPNSIIGDFIDYLLARHQSRILAIHILRR